MNVTWYVCLGMEEMSVSWKKKSAISIQHAELMVATIWNPMKTVPIDSARTTKSQNFRETANTIMMLDFDLVKITLHEISVISNLIMAVKK